MRQERAKETHKGMALDPALHPHCAVKRQGSGGNDVRRKIRRRQNTSATLVAKCPIKAFGNAVAFPPQKVYHKSDLWLYVKGENKSKK